MSEIRRCAAVMLLLVLALLMCISMGELEDDVIAKDLYAVLGVDKTASKKDIRAAYRQLAKVHHPDKSSTTDREINAKIFRDVAESYEVLGNEGDRREYDNRRSFYRGRGGGEQHQRFQSFERPSDYHQDDRRRQHEAFERQSEYERGQGGHSYPSAEERAHMEQAYMGYMHEYEASMRAFERKLYGQEAAYMEEMARGIGGGGGGGGMGEGFGINQVVQPFLVGNTMLEGDVLFPYSPILSSVDGSHFAMVDADCSFVVYRGDAQMFLADLYHSGGDLRQLSWHLYQQLYRSKGAPGLEGACFAGLDRGGVLKVFAGHPERYDHFNPVWTTGFLDGDDDYGGMGDQLGARMTSYFLELSSVGDATIRAVTVGNPESACVWSTTSCDEFVSIVKETLGGAMGVLRGLARSVRGLSRFVKHGHAEGGAVGAVVALLKGSLVLLVRGIYHAARAVVRFVRDEDDDNDDDGGANFPF